MSLCCLHLSDSRLSSDCQSGSFPGGDVGYGGVGGRSSDWRQQSRQGEQLSLSCAKSHMLSASQRQPHLLHVSAVDHRQTWSMDKS